MENKFRILLVEDDEVLASLLPELANMGEVDWKPVKTLLDGLRLLALNSIDAVWLDLGLPDSHDVDTLTTLKESFPLVPVAVCTGNTDENIRHKCLTAGAVDFVPKDILSEERIKQAVHTLKTISWHSKQEHETMKTINRAIDSTLRKIESIGHT